MFAGQANETEAETLQMRNQDEVLEQENRTLWISPFSFRKNIPRSI